ncbi:ABC transporter substrate-binding protein [Aestuariibacter halophilus]|uniref:ABC transporter substrate-binding protein n=1 Tax=Fluctibacter halophilus TaxID=226011 RepID=A0ABS8G741_9ALTE|nr:ABC transporter substrate-binding protein [Aestuariibacter halophilus]MCC2615891.1 ABC transporter substrate-binding protein [Aestuariibacter halophilus]
MKQLRMLLMSLGLLALPMVAWADRLVTAGGTITEIVFTLGAGQQVVATDQSSTYPREATQRPRIGYYRDLAAEGILAMDPHRLLTIEGAGRQQVLDQLVAAGVEVIVYPKPLDPDGLFSLIRRIGKDIHRTEQAHALVRQLQQQLPAGLPMGNHKGLYLLSASDRGLIAAGQDTVPALLFSYVGIHNVADTHQGFKAINREALLLANPDFLVVPDHMVASLGGQQALCDLPVLALLPAAQQCNVLIMDGLISLGMTPRLPEGISTLNAFVTTQASLP